MRRIIRILIRVVGIFIFLFLVLFLVIQIPSVQSWATKSLEEYIHNKTKTKVEIGNISLRFFDGVNISDVYIEDLNRDTLLYSKEITAHLGLNPLSILNNKLVIDKVVLKTTRLYLITYAGNKESNLDQIIALLFPKKATPDNSKGLELVINGAELSNSSFLEFNQNSGSYLQISATKAKVELDKLDIPNKVYAFTSGYFDSPQVVIQNHKPKQFPVIPVDTTVQEFAGENKPLFLKFGRVRVKNGSFSNDDFTHESIALTNLNEIDYGHLKVVNIDIRAKEFITDGRNYSAEPFEISFKENKGFVLENLSASHISLSSTKGELRDLKLKTPYSNLGDAIEFNYTQFSDWNSFNDNIKMKINFKNSQVALRDILTFAPSLAKSTFINTNYNEVFKLDGKIKGTVNDLNAKELVIKMGKHFNLEADFSSKDLAVPDQGILNLNLKDLNTDIQFLKDIIPTLKLPPTFNKLGKLNFKGRFDGYLTDFVAFGTLNTDVGAASVDMRMDLNKDNPNYSGNIKLSEFNLGKWVDEPKLGTLSATLAVKNGSGLTADKVNAQLEGLIEKVSYNGYQYSNIVVNGSFKKNIIDGIIQSNDPNAFFDFNGKIDLSGNKPTYDFYTNIKNISLQTLKLTTDDLKVKGILNINIETKGLNDILGNASIANFEVKRADEVILNLDTLRFVARQQSATNKTISLRSDVADLDIKGKFDILKIDKIFLNYLQSAHPRYYSDLKLPPHPEIKDNYKFDYNLVIKDAGPITKLVNKKIEISNGVSLSGVFNSIDNTWTSLLSLPSLTYDTYHFDSVTINLKNNDRSSNISGKIGEAKLGETVLPNLNFDFLVRNDSSRFDLKGLNVFQSDFSSRGIVMPMENGYKIHFSNDTFNLLGEAWIIDRNNSLYIQKERVNTSFFYLTNHEKKIMVNNTEDNGIEFAILGYDMSQLNKLIKMDNMKTAGKLQIYAKVSDLYKFKNLGLTLNSDSLYINNDYWGRMAINATAEDLKSVINGDYIISKENMEIAGKVAVDLKDPKNIGLNFKSKLKNVPLKTLEYFLGDGLTQTAGTVSGSCSLTGPASKLDLDGSLKINNGAFKIDYLGTKYFINETTVNINNNIIDASNTILTDEEGNTATVHGGLVHDHFKNWGYKVKVESNKFLALNTTSRDNKVYYGRGIVKLALNISGSFEKTNMYINITTTKGCALTIPFGNAAQAKTSKYVRFVNHNADSTTVENVFKYKDTEKGMNVDIDLTLTEDALIQLILDQNAGDNIEGYGKGNIQLAFTRSGEFSMYGDYEIETGEYLFTLLNLVNKPFEINSGSIVRWNGDPLEGEINLTASYKDLYTSPYNFIIDPNDPTQDENIKREAKKSTKVDLTLNLTGRLLQPNIKLDIDFPNISSILRGYVDSRLRVIRQDQNEMNRQAMALIVTKTFIPQNSGFQGTQYTTSINTLSELLSGQLSNYITDLFSGIITDKSVISSIDLDIGYNVNTYEDLKNPNPFKSSEFQLRLKNNLFSDRLTINVGGNVGTNENTINAQSSDTYVTGDLEVSWALTPDNRLKVRVYQRSEPSIEGGRKNRTGVGLSYRREFDSFSELVAELKRKVKK